MANTALCIASYADALWKCLTVTRGFYDKLEYFPTNKIYLHSKLGLHVYSTKQRGADVGLYSNIQTRVTFERRRAAVEDDEDKDDDDWTLAARDRDDVTVTSRRPDDDDVSDDDVDSAVSGRLLQASVTSSMTSSSSSDDRFERERSPLQ